jgi:glycosyltransferase involved in cell wall biosynthesis
MKIIFSHYGTLDGGDACGFSRSFPLASGLAKLNNNIIFLTTQKKGFKFPYLRETRNEVIIYAFAEIFPYSFRKGGLSPLSTILKIIFVLFHKADIVHSDTGHRPSSGWACIVHRFIYKSKYFSEWWEYFGKGGIYDDMPLWYQLTLGKYDNLFEVTNRKKANGCIPISHKLKERALKSGIPKEKILVLNGGADIKSIEFVQNPQINRATFNLPMQSIIIGIIGFNDEEVENHLLLIKAIIQLNAEGYNLFLIGTGSISERLKREHSLTERNMKVFNWLPYDQFCSLISCVDVFALIQKDNLRNKSRFPNKLGDYLAVGRPIITNAIGETSLYLKKYPKAFYFTDNSSNDILITLRLILKNIDKDENLFSSIRDIAIENSWNARAIELNTFYHKICYSSHKN